MPQSRILLGVWDEVEVTHTRLSMADTRTPLPLENLRWDKAHKWELREGQFVPSLWPR